MIIVDVRLDAGQRGDDFARELQGDLRYKRIPVVLMSGDIQELRRLDGEASARVGKPFDVQHLYDVLAEVCAERVGTAR